MSCGWVRVRVPAALAKLMTWRVVVGAASGGAGELIAAPEGDRSVVVEAELRLPGVHAAARLEVGVPVTGGRVTTVGIPNLGLQAVFSPAAPAR